MSSETTTKTTKAKGAKQPVSAHAHAPAVPVSGKVAAILVRGLVRVNPQIRDTLFSLRLRRKHICIVLDNNPITLGMLVKSKDYITYGEVSEETVKELVAKRGKKDEEGKLKPFFELAPPRGGFERKGIKKAFNQGGALGYRGEKMNDLVKKMI